MSSKLPKAVMDIKPPTAYLKVLATAAAVANGLTEHAAIYTTPDPTVIALTAQETILHDLATKVDDGDHSEIPARDEASITLYRMLQTELVYVNKIGNHDRAILGYSGFPVSLDPAPRPVPPQLVIKRIEDAKQPRTAKIFIERTGLTSFQYIVQKSTTPGDEASWKEVLTCSSSFKLIMHDMIHGQETWFRVCARNVAGYGFWSVPVPFISRM